MPSRSSCICVQDRGKTVAICEKYTNYYIHIQHYICNNVFEGLKRRLFHFLANLATKLSIFIFVSVGLDLSKWVALTLFRDHIQLPVVPWPCDFFSYAAIVW